MGDRATVVLAAVVAAAALAAVDGHVGGVPLLAGPAVGALAVAIAPRSGATATALLCLAAGLLAAALGQRAVDGLEAPLTTGRVHTEVTLVGDPRPTGRGSVAVDVRHGGRRLRALARTSAAAALDDRLAGERVTVIGAVRSPGRYEHRQRHRHLAGRLVVDTVTDWRPGSPVTRAANGLRRTLARGAEGLPERRRALLAGLTLGDVRDQPPDMTESFRAAGLTHLTAVSGQNVAFVLAIAAPVLSRLRFGARLAGTLAVLAGFAVVTRAEPSVLRAVAMAGVAAIGGAVGRPAASVRALVLGSAAMILVDPLLVTSLGFQLSVLGAAGIVALARPLERRLPGPRWWTAPLAVTLAAQAAVAPLLAVTFGGVPLVSVPANLLAAPAAGPIMVWGLTGGLAAGIFGGVVARLLHLPTQLLLAWLDVVAGASAPWSAAALRPVHVAVLAVAAVLAWSGRRTRWGSAGRVGIALTIVAALLPLRGPPPDLGGVALGPGADVWRAGGGTVLVVDGRASADHVVAGLRSHRLGVVDLLVVRTPSPGAAAVATEVRRAPGAALTVAARGSAAAAEPGAVEVARATRYEVGDLLVDVATDGDRLTVTVIPRTHPPHRPRPAARRPTAGAYPRRPCPSPTRPRARRPPPRWRCPAARSTSEPARSSSASSPPPASGARTRWWPRPPPSPPAARISSTSRTGPG